MSSLTSQVLQPLGEGEERSQLTRRHHTSHTELTKFHQEFWSDLVIMLSCLKVYSYITYRSKKENISDLVWALSIMLWVTTTKMSSPNAVSMSMTTALIYGMSGGFFFLLVFLLVLMGMTNCAWNCCSWCRLASWIFSLNSLSGQWRDSVLCLHYIRSGFIIKSQTQMQKEGPAGLSWETEDWLVLPWHWEEVNRYLNKAQLASVSIGEIISV